MTTAIQTAFPQECLTKASNWLQQNPQTAIVTAVAFGVLGIGLAAGAAYLLAASVTLAAILGLASALSLGASAAIAFTLMKNFRHPEQVQGVPPNIPLSDVAAQQNYRVQIMNQTLGHLRAGSYQSPDGTRHSLDLTRAAQGASLLLSAGNVAQRPGAEPTRIVVRNQDCLYAAADLHARGLNPMILDMASDGHFGGGYLVGARAQEEDCCRRSGLCYAADTQHGVQTRNFYPLSGHSAGAGVYVPHVPIFRAGYDKGYQLLNQPFEAAFGIFAGFNNPPLDLSSGSPRLRPAEAVATREKIRCFFEMARQQGHQSVVFGALGCGAFRNPPDHIAEIAIDVINREFAHCFIEIVIAVLDDHNAGPGGNFRPFARRALAAGGRAIDAQGQELTTL